MTNDETLAGEQLRIATLRLPQLSAPRPPGDVPTFAQLGLAELADECEVWQLQRANSVFWELNHWGSRPDAWREIPVLMGSTAESALLAGTAEVEINL